MLQIEIDGKKVSVKEGSNVIEAAHAAGTYIPHFCYHKKLSIAANCRMCLVDVEKAPKPLPACATPVTDGMIVRTTTEKAKKAQKAVLEFLLINHPLDCPICDQGGECQLQDLSMGYGTGESRFHEDKHVFVAKYMGPLISCQEMSRCIHCTRCVRFSTEIAGFQEIGMAGRGGYSEIMSFIGKTVNSEISGNVIDLCPVGALTSKPFRYTARSWELSRRRSVSPHDALGSNLIIQTKNRKVKRVLPYENEEINECWLSDRDRFSYEGLNSEDRLTTPKIKQDNKWIDVDWPTAINYVVKGLKGVAKDHGEKAIGFVANPMNTVEELFLAKKLARSMGVQSFDSNLRLRDRRVSKARAGALWLGTSIQELGHKKAILVIGSNLRQEQPLLTARIRRACQAGSKVMTIGATIEDLRMKTYAQLMAHPSEWTSLLGELKNDVAAHHKGFSALKEQEARQLKTQEEKIAKAMEEGGEEAVKALPKMNIVHPHLTYTQDPDSIDKIGEVLGFFDKDEVIVLIGAEAQRHPQYFEIYRAVQELAEEYGFDYGVLPTHANSVGADLLKFEPVDGGQDVFGMMDEPKKAVVLMNVEPTLDVMEGARFAKALKEAETVIAMNVFDSPEIRELADVILPVVPFTETRGSFVNMEGRLQSFYATVECLGDAKPMWKVLRVIGSALALGGFEYDSTDEIMKDAFGDKDISKLVENRIALTSTVDVVDRMSGDDIVRVGGVGLYHGDPIVRRAKSLQKTVWAKEPMAIMNPETIEKLSLKDGEEVSIEGSGTKETVKAVLKADPTVAKGVVFMPLHESNARLGSLMNTVNVKRG